MNKHQWENHRIEVRSHSLPKYLWNVFRFSVEVDGKDVYMGSINMRLKEVVNFKIHEAERIIEGEVQTLFPSSAIYVRYKLIINNIEIERGGVTADNWYMPFVFLSLIALGIILL
ncbi:MAG: hypothetical protein KKH12_03710 [Gammaproteobacteria bacterium]|nr:hypothetical protein [Gammaproteobacteria bacterium]MBU1480762.1 hypothetical protein [Gammaproteobacteria bacterium]